MELRPDDNIMTNKNPHIGSTFESWLDEKGMREDVTAAAIKSVIADQIAAAMKERCLTKSRMAAMSTRAAHNSTVCSIPRAAA